MGTLRENPLFWNLKELLTMEIDSSTQETGLNYVCRVFNVPLASVKLLMICYCG